MTPYERAILKAQKEQYGSEPTPKDKPSQKGATGRGRGISDGRSDLEALFDNRLDVCAPDLPKPEGYRGSEQRKPIHDRLFRADRYWHLNPERYYSGVIVEIEGVGHGTIDWKNRDNGRSRYDSDVEKYNLCAVYGYCVLRVTKYMLDNDPQSFFDLLRRALRREEE